MSYHLFLDDQRKPTQVIWANLPECQSWVIVRNFDEFRETILNKGIPSFVSFDCDLDEEHYQYANRGEFLMKQYKGEFKQKTGIDCALYLKEHCNKHNKQLPEFCVHSMNSVGAGEIKRVLDSKPSVA